MISYPVYKVLHIIGAFLTIAGITAMPVYYSMGGEHKGRMRKTFAMSHGIGLFILIVAGFGMLARLQISASQPWVIGKIIIWILLGAWVALARRMSQRLGLIWTVTIGLAGVAAYLAVFKPV